MKLIYFLLFFCFLQNSVNSQDNNRNLNFAYSKDTLRVDRNNKPINKRIYDYKLDSSLFSSLRFENDTLVLYKLRFSYLFGELEAEKKTQLYHLLYNRNEVDTTKIMVIHYQDTLRSIDYFPEKSKIVYSNDSTSHHHLINHKTFIKQYKDCLKMNKKRGKNNVYHFYAYNEGHPKEFEKIKWKKDYFGLIDQLFRDDYYRFNTLVLHPNGTFFGYNYEDNNITIYQDIIRGKHWPKHKADFEKRVKALDAM